jgi:hypothetical protein
MISSHAGIVPQGHKSDISSVWTADPSMLGSLAEVCAGECEAIHTIEIYFTRCSRRDLGPEKPPAHTPSGIRARSAAEVGKLNRGIGSKTDQGQYRQTGAGPHPSDHLILKRSAGARGSLRDNPVSKNSIFYLLLLPKPLSPATPHSRSSHARLGQLDRISPLRMAEMLEVDKAGQKVRC